MNQGREEILRFVLNVSKDLYQPFGNRHTDSLHLVAAGVAKATGRKVNIFFGAGGIEKLPAGQPSDFDGIHPTEGG